MGLLGAKLSHGLNTALVAALVAALRVCQRFIFLGFSPNARYYPCKGGLELRNSERGVRGALPFGGLEGVELLLHEGGRNARLLLSLGETRKRGLSTL